MGVREAWRVHARCPGNPEARALSRVRGKGSTCTRQGLLQAGGRGSAGVQGSGRRQRQNVTENVEQKALVDNIALMRKLPKSIKAHLDQLTSSIFGQKKTKILGKHPTNMAALNEVSG